MRRCVPVLVGCLLLPSFPAAAHAGSDESQSHRLYVAAIAAAEKALRLHEPAEVRRWLLAAPDEFRGWEWQYLNAMSDESLAGTPIGDDRATSLDVSPAGNHIAVAHASGAVVIRDVSGFREVVRFAPHGDAIYSVRYSPDGSQLLTVSRDQTSRILHAETGGEIARLTLDNPGVAAAEYSPDGSRAATCTWLMETDPRRVRGVVWIWDPADGSTLSRTLIAEHPLDSLAWTPDGQQLVVGCWDGTVSILDADGKLRGRVEVPQEDTYTAVISVAVSPDGRYVACGSKDRTARVWQLQDRKLIATLTGHAGFVSQVRFAGSAEQPQLLTASTDGTLRTWDVQNQKQLTVLNGHQSSVDAVVLTPDDRQAVSVSADGTLRRWDLTGSFGGGIRTKLDTRGSYSVVPSPDGRRVYVAMYDGRVVVLNADDGTVVTDWLAHDGSTCNTLALSGDGRRLLTCSWDRSAKLWDPQSQALLLTMEADTGIRSCALSHDGTTAALFAANAIELRNTDDGSVRHSLSGHTEPVMHGVFTHNGQKLITASTDGTARVWQVSDGQEIRVLEAQGAPLPCVAVAPDDELLATGYSDGTVRLWDIATGTCRRTYATGSHEIHALSFSPTGDRLAAGSARLAILDPDHDGILLSCSPQPDTIYHLSFSPDGQRIVSCTTGGSIVFSDTRPVSVRRSPANSSSVTGTSP